MTLFLWNIFLALVWASATGQFSPANLAAGYLLGFAVLWFTRRAFAPTPYFSRVRRWLSLLVFFLKELVVANFRLAYDVITPAYRMKPAIIAVPLDASTGAEITFLANLITMTPGTLSLDVSEDRRTLYIHAMFAADADAVRREVKEGFERRILEVLR